MTPSRDVPAKLSVGSHLAPEDGVCLMEAVSDFAGLPWSDEPACTHPLVAHLARLVNDASSDDGRSRLAAFVPRLAAAAGDETTYARVPRVCAEVALRWRRSLLLAHLGRLADAEIRREVTARGLGRPRSTLLASRVYRRGPAYRTVEAAVASARVFRGEERDRALADLLDAVLAGGLPVPTSEHRVAQLHRSPEGHTEEGAREGPHDREDGDPEHHVSSLLNAPADRRVARMNVLQTAARP